MAHGAGTALTVGLALIAWRCATARVLRLLWFNFNAGLGPQRHHTADCHYRRRSVLGVRLQTTAEPALGLHPRPQPDRHPGRRNGVLPHLRALAVLRGAPVSTPMPPTAVHRCPLIT